MGSTADAQASSPVAVWRQRSSPRTTPRRIDMNSSTSRLRVRFATIVATATLVAACGAEAPVAPEGPALRTANTRADAAARALATLRRATARYHDLTAATDDGFVFLHGCESRPD